MAAPSYTLTLADIIVAGPTQVMASVNGTDWVSFGMTDNDNLPQWIDRDTIHRVTTSASGASPEQLVHQGITAALSVVMVQYSTTVLGQIKALMRGGTANKAVIGSVLAASTAASSKTFGLRIVPLTTGNPGIEFARCWVEGDSWTESQWGNVEKRLSFAANVMPDPSTGTLWTILANS